jgi:vancomycin resistance protein YoaR
VQSVLSPRQARRATTEQQSGRAAVAVRTALSGARFVRLAIADSPAWMRRSLYASLIALVALAGLCGYQSQNRVMGGLIIAGQPIGGLSYAEAQAMLDQRAAQFDSQRVTLTYQGKTWQPNLADLGVTLDTETAWATVVQYRSPRYLLDRVLRTFLLQSSPVSLGTPLRVDAPTLESYCRERMTELGLAPVDAELKVDGESILVTQDAGGLVISVDRLQKDLVRQLSGFTTPRIDLTATYSPAMIRANEIESEISSLSSVLQQPMHLYTDTDQWDIPPSQMAANLKIDQSNGRPTLMIDDAAITGLVDRIANEIDQPVSNGSVDDSGIYARIIAPHDGVTVDRATLNQRIHDAITTGLNEVEIPVTTTPSNGDLKPLLTKYGITDLLATGSSSFVGSDPGRTTNVRRAAELIDGTLVAPGEVFSFNQALGSIVDVGGFVPAGATEGGIPGTAVGGGVCQVSTSVFRAALRAGLPITEWYPHAYRSMYYEQDGWAPGFDASIQQPDEDPLNGPDLKFTNVTDGWLLVRATASSTGELKVSLFGTATGFDIVISDPNYGAIVPADQAPVEEVDDSLPSGTMDLWQPARDGVTMSFHRTVYAADGTLLIDEDFVSYYQPQGPVYRVSPDKAGSATAGY